MIKIRNYYLFHISSTHTGEISNVGQCYTKTTKLQIVELFMKSKRKTKINVFFH